MTVRLARPESESELGQAIRDLAGQAATDSAGTRKVVSGPVVTGSPELSRDVPPAADTAESGLAACESTVISTARLSEVISFRPRDLTVEVGTGMRIRELVKLVEEHNLWLPVSGPGLHRSVGGWVSAASPSAWDASVGPVRRQLLGCRMVTPAGGALTWGRAVMKNVAGYDMPRLIAGSRGRLGILTTVTIRLWPRPSQISAYEMEDGTDDDLEWTGADAIAWHWSRGRGAWRTVAFAGGTESVRRRRAQISGRANVADRVSVSEWPVRTPESVVYRLTPGRRYLATAFRDLTRSAAPNLAAIEAWPASGAMLVEYDSGQLHGIPERTPDPDRPDPAMAVGIERGGPQVHDRAAALRDMGAVAIEQRIERALGAWPRSWLADYV